MKWRGCTGNTLSIYGDYIVMKIQYYIGEGIVIVSRRIFYLQIFDSDSIKNILTSFLPVTKLETDELVRYTHLLFTTFPMWD